MVKLTLSFVMLGLGLATAAVAYDMGSAISGSVYTNPYKKSGSIGDADLDTRLARVSNLQQLRDAVYEWLPGKYTSLFEKSLGICEENSKKCNQVEMVCSLGTPDCRKVKQGEEMDELIYYFTVSYLTVFTHGKCQHNSETSKWCSKLGLCNKYYVQNDEKCKNLDLSEGSADVDKVIDHSSHTNADAYSVEYDVPAGSYTLAEQKKG
ncbi:hypothetical protein NDA10_006129 [Ustilago hordei]|uniref:Uncharacterized protein n=1 Tax=Ustilago hordei TaxID=120017 RepID=I2FXB0_USTHO|nr:uncharacterized protein UHO2_04361 [Ustilago hordei]KAJ1036964.1 hypothetical protein NDA10_006129 [Ustilago hordei]CCF51553.1 uncharacterized protein UHOR_14977 [Ustilago hordei]SYW79718.1 uncharacterized protein UHO2_04361 [Ustilago hordei]